jgi:hypothetical protein
VVVHFELFVDVGFQNAIFRFVEFGHWPSEVRMSKKADMQATGEGSGGDGRKQRATHGEFRGTAFSDYLVSWICRQNAGKRGVINSGQCVHAFLLLILAPIGLLLFRAPSVA